MILLLLPKYPLLILSYLFLLRFEEGNIFRLDVNSEGLHANHERAVYQCSCMEDRTIN